MDAQDRVEVFLWECMALSPPLVHTLSDEWMRDDYSTLTNAYPDNEDIQGPAGHDVARVIALSQGDVPRGRGTVLVACAGTSDLPVAEEAATPDGRADETDVLAVGLRRGAQSRA